MFTVVQLSSSLVADLFLLCLRLLFDRWLCWLLLSGLSGLLGLGRLRLLLLLGGALRWCLRSGRGLSLLLERLLNSNVRVVIVLVFTQKLGTFLEDTLFTADTFLLGAFTAGNGLVGEHLRALHFSLLLVDEFHQHTLVLEHVTFAFEVEFMVAAKRRSNEGRNEASVCTHR